MGACFRVCFQKIPWLLLKKSCKWSVVNVGQINHALENLAAVPRHSYRVRNFAIAVGACATIRGQNWMKTVILEMTGILKRLMTMALQTNNKDEFVYVILPGSLIFKLIIKFILKHVLVLFLTGLYDLLGCYWKILRNLVIILSLTTAYWRYESSHILKLFILKY